ncbi:hypothetical protein SEA_MUFASA8_31 [Arthrobacter phage Mufasa8]|uniref:Uncharacterized protein n=1 Tax=Arthrobacter phage Mufasa8 TaxID=2656526 RepID=A0A649VM32_9CAUD|nr:hypothetical protein HYQ08_gp031 [Arthrobacter phage Mufasa8]QGJ93480.1 hypothetical protein SEA_MUFASA8_31 [Arthrobacter phage Mufasa8]
MSQSAAAAAPLTFQIEKDYEEEARPLTTRQIAVLNALHDNLVMTVPFDVLPPVEGNDDITASAEWDGSSRFLVEVDPEGFLVRVAVRFKIAGHTDWLNLSRTDRTTYFYDRVKLVARDARRTVPTDAQ